MPAQVRVPPSLRRPEVHPLTGEEKRRVASYIRTHRVACPACAARHFEVGRALYLGFLFVAAERDEYMVALSCTNPGCPMPRSGVRLRRRDFLERDLPRE